MVTSTPSSSLVAVVGSPMLRTASLEPERGDTSTAVATVVETLERLPRPCPTPRRRSLVLPDQPVVVLAAERLPYPATVPSSRVRVTSPMVVEPSPVTDVTALGCDLSLLLEEVRAELPGLREEHRRSIDHCEQRQPPHIEGPDSPLVRLRSRKSQVELWASELAAREEALSTREAHVADECAITLREELVRANEEETYVAR